MPASICQMLRLQTRVPLMTPTPPEDEKSDRQGTGFWSVVQSVLAAGVGIQSKANKERDFKRGKAIHFIVGGLIGTLCFVVLIFLVVQYLIHSVS